MPWLWFRSCRLARPNQAHWAWHENMATLAAHTEILLLHHIGCERMQNQQLLRVYSTVQGCQIYSVEPLHCRACRQQVILVPHASKCRVSKAHFYDKQPPPLRAIKGQTYKNLSKISHTDIPSLQVLRLHTCGHKHMLS
jgi:hypothetical protein